MSERKDNGSVAQPVHGDLADDERAAGFWWGPSGDDDASDVLLSRDGRSLARANERRWEVFEAPWDAKSPSPIAWGSESSRRTNRAAAASEARARGLLRSPPAAPSGLRVAGLLRAVEDVARRLPYESSDDITRGRIYGLKEAADLIRAHLGKPTPEERTAAEVLAVDAADVIPSTVETIGDHAVVVREILADISGPTARKRALFARAARVALAAMAACDAAAERKGGA